MLILEDAEYFNVYAIGLISFNDFFFFFFFFFAFRNMICSLDWTEKQTVAS